MQCVCGNGPDALTFGHSYEFMDAVSTRPAGSDYPAAQWIDFFTGFQDVAGNRIGRTTGVAVGPQGSLFVADDASGNIDRIRPVGTPGSARARRPQ